MVNNEKTHPNVKNLQYIFETGDEAEHAVVEETIALAEEAREIRELQDIVEEVAEPEKVFFSLS